MEKEIIQIAQELRAIKKELQHLNKTLEQKKIGSFDCESIAENFNRRIEERIQESSL